MQGEEGSERGRGAEGWRYWRVVLLGGGRIVLGMEGVAVVKCGGARCL